jgi:uncharacterized membrane protein YtjA (UPF0391 family)
VCAWSIFSFLCSAYFLLCIHPLFVFLSFSTWPLYYLFCPFPRGHCIICSVLFHVAIVLSVLSFSTWPLYYLFCPFPRGHCIICSVLFHVVIVLFVLSFSTWPLYYLFCPFPRGHCIICSVLFHVAIVLTVLSFLLNNYKVGLKMTLIDHMHLISITASHEGGSQRPLISP